MPAERLKADSTLLILVTLLLVFGTVMVYSASSFKAEEATGDSNYFLKRHFLKVLVAFVLMLVVAKTPYQFWLRISPLLLGLCVLALVFLLVSPTVEPIRGSRRWIDLGVLRVQPSDFARVALVLFLSHKLSRLDFHSEQATQNYLKTLGSVALVILPILLQPDIGTAALIAFIAVALIFLAGERLRHLAIPALTALPLFVLFLRHNEYQRNRILQYVAALRGEEASWQVQQSLIAFGSGNLFGVGLGGGRQKYHFLPDPFTDFIFAIVGEELGLIGTVAILALFFVLFWRGFRIAMLASDSQARLLASGVVLNVAVYVVANVGVATNLLPTTGIPLPFISYGGSAMLANLFAMGLLLNISAQVKRERSLHPTDNRYTRGRRFYGHGRP